MKTTPMIGAVALSVWLLCGCGGGGGRAPADPAPAPAPTELAVSGSPATDGIFDAAPASDGGSTLWMSYSSVTRSASDPTLGRVRTRLASSTSGGERWTDAGVDPSNLTTPDFQVGATWVTWRFEVSRLLYDPHDAVASRRWKVLWHRYATMTGNVRLFQNGWIGLATAATPGGAWSTERKLFTGTAYNAADMNAVIGAPEFPLATTYPGASQLGGCSVFTEPGLLARSEGIYVSLQCAGAGKVALLRCDHGFSACSYLGDLLVAGEAAPFSLSGQSLTGFGATELVDAGGSTYLIVTGYEPPDDSYRGCLVFRVRDLATAAVERDGGGAPVLVKRVAGTPGSFNGACGYHASATGSGIIYGEYSATAPSFRLYASHVALP